ncbi:MAG: ABC transporter ATP-binding protein [SAR324 cluster bacterium]|nr:ABC transporter ATP-binding protein [SAR324 cluster bacterium]MCZ6729998.1 ABC transporter ATP-binding protein [SAR324 cluster bacterium]
MSEPGFIVIEDLHKHYLDGQGNELHVLRGVNLAIQRKETVSVMGASGAGKSTLLHLIGALDRAGRGSITIGGLEVSSLNGDSCAQFRNETIGFVFQFHHLLMDFSALENVMMPMWIKAKRTLPCQAQAMALLEAVGIAERASHRPSQLSGGEQQRLAIARALANQPQILLADEPTGNLDESTGQRVSDLLLRLNRELGLTLILMTHNHQIAAQMTRQYVLEQGRLNSAKPDSANA